MPKEVKTFSMRCPNCKKTTQCKALNPPKGKRAMAGGRRFICTECEMGFSVAIGGIPTTRPYGHG